MARAWEHLREARTYALTHGIGVGEDDDAAARRARLGRHLGLGFANAKTFLRRLNTYGVTRAEFYAALEELQ